MKMLVSDYDGTFYINDEDIKRNINLVNKFMKDNLFVMNTGRSYFDYKKKMDLYNITSNYLVINHGTTILKDDLAIYNVPIDDLLKDKIIEDLELDKVVDIFSCSEKESRVSLKTKNLTKIHVMYSTKEQAQIINKKLMDKYSNEINIFLVCGDKALEIVSKKADKAKAIDVIEKLEKISKEDIYTIGDNYSDIEMVKKYKGFSMINSVEDLKTISIKQYKSVSDLILELMSENN